MFSIGYVCILKISNPKTKIQESVFLLTRKKNIYIYIECLKKTRKNTQGGYTLK